MHKLNSLFIENYIEFSKSNFINKYIKFQFINQFHQINKLFLKKINQALNSYIFF